MKKTAISGLVLSPYRWLRKIRGFRIVYTPLLAIVLFTAVMGIILGTLHLQEKTQQEAALFRELSFAKQRIQSRFVSNLDALTTINREVATSEDQVKLRQIALGQAEDLVLSNHEIVRIIWLNNQNQKQWSVPAESSKSDWISKTQNDQLINSSLSSTIELSRVTSRAAFSQFISLNLPGDAPIATERKIVLWQVVPNIVGGEIVGFLAALYTTQGILDVIPGKSTWDILG
jgi:hypothetical protein